MTDLDKLIDAVERGSISTDHLIGALDHPMDMWGLAAFDGSLDAAKALHEALLPRKDYSIDTCDGLPSVTIWEEQDSLSVAVLEENNPARAWLLAILKAYRSVM